MTKWMAVNFFFFFNLNIWLSLAGSHSQSKTTSNKTAGKNTIKLMLEKGYHKYVIKTMVKTIK